jgi:hypothetical protein
MVISDSSVQFFKQTGPGLVNKNQLEMIRPSNGFSSKTHIRTYSILLWKKFKISKLASMSILPHAPGQSWSPFSTL